MYNFTVYGMPGPQGSKRYVGQRGGRGVMIESSEKVKPWREAVKYAALQARAGAGPLDGPLEVTMSFTLPKPASAPKKRRTWPDKKPDLSKLVRSTEDALVDAGLIRDDARIVHLRVFKCFPCEPFDLAMALDAPGVIIIIRAAQE